MTTITKTKMKTVTLPSKEVIHAQLKKTKLIGWNLERDRFYETYVDSVANNARNAKDLVNGWNQTISLWLEEYPQRTGTLNALVMFRTFDTVVRTIAPELAEYAIMIRNEKS